MKTQSKHQRGAVLVVALIMLSMVTFLVVAFVGFSRFERASVEASMVRAEAGHAFEIGLVEAQQEVVEQIRNNINHGLMVSQNEDGNGTLSIPTNHQGLVNFATGLTNLPRVPVYIDHSGDGVQDKFPFYLDLNAATNHDGARYQGTVVDFLGRQALVGDPHWIGLLEKPDQPHGPENKFVARYAHLTVPAHKALNIRYHHNDQKRSKGSPNFDQFSRLQGIYPREINLAAPFGMIHPGYFKYQEYSPYAKSASMPVGVDSAYSFASALGLFGHQIEDAMHLSRPSKGYNELLSMNRTRNDFDGAAARQLDRLKGWLTHRQAPPYSYYQFMGLFSSTPLPVEPGKFDVNGIRDEVVEGTAFIDTNLPGLPSTFPGLSVLTFTVPHGLKSGDKLEWAGAPGSLTFPPMIYDPITFDVISDDMTDTEKQNRLELLTQRILHTTVPHHLVPHESVRINSPRGIGGGLTWLQSQNKKGFGYPYGPAPFFNTDMVLYSDVPIRPPQAIPTSEATELMLMAPTEIASAYNMKTNWWGSWDGKKWVPKYRAKPALAGGALPDEFISATCTLTYRAEPRRLDLIPYFVKVIDESQVTLHRSAQLEEFSKVILCYPRSQFKYSNGVFTGVDQHARLFRQGNTVRFVIPNDANGNLVTASGAVITEKNTFMLRKLGTVPLQFMLPDPADSSKALKMQDGFTYTLQVVPKSPFHNFQHDGLTAVMEKMVGLMLNESLDTTGDGTTAVHSLGGQLLPKEKEDSSDPNPLAFVAAPPFPLKMGIGGRQEALGPWHHSQKGIPWGTNLVPGNPEGAGRYTREMERIVQVAANIADLYSEPPANISTHPKMFGYPLFGKDLVQFSRNIKTKSAAVNNPRGMLRFGDIKSDNEISADIRQNSILTGGLSGLGLGEYFAYFKSDPSTLKNNRVKGRVYLQIGVAGVPVATSRELELDVWGPLKGPVTWLWRLNTLWPNPDKGDEEYWIGYKFRMTCEAGREVRVFFNDEEILSYENGKRTSPGRASLLSYDADAVFTNLKPWVKLGKQTGNAQCLDFNNNTWKWHVDVSPSLGWATSRKSKTPNVLPTAYKGVFRRDEWNNVYLTGFQRKNLPLLTLFDSDSKPDPTGLLNSWYQRFAPTVIGVKDRSNSARPSPGHNMHPVITEVALRVNFDRQSKNLYGRLVMEVYVPENIVGAPKPYIISARAGIIGGECVAVRTDSQGGQSVVTMPLSIVKDFRPYSTGSSIASPASMTISLTPGRHTIIFGPKPGFTFAGMNLVDIPPTARVNPKTGFKPLLSTEVPLSDGMSSLTNIRIENLKLAFEGEIQVGHRAVEYIKDTFEIEEPVKFSNPAPLNNEWPFIPAWKATDNYGKVGNAENPRRVIYNNMFWYLTVPDLPRNPKNKPPGIDPRWKKLPWDLRKIEISWQSNDPLVNSHAKDFKVNDYSPPNLVGVNRPKASPNAKTYRAWMPSDAHNKPFQFPKLPHKASGHNWGFGVNMALKNDASQHWGRGNSDSSIKDPGVGLYASNAPHLDWRFPDISRGPIENIGWLGQVHRGTPWQTLYLKSKIPGSVNVISINDATGEAVTATAHNLAGREFVELSGTKPATWENVGNVGEVKGEAQVTGPNTFMLLDAAGNALQGLDGNRAVYGTPGLLTVSSTWANWAGSADTMPANDRRLLEPLAVGGGISVRGRFSVNNDSRAAWSAALCGLSVPLRNVFLNGNSKIQRRIIGANDPNISPYPFQDQSGFPRTEYPADRDARIDLTDGSWVQIVSGINAARGTNTFTRVTDVLATPQLTDRSPYLPVAWRHVSMPGFQDELDLERIPMQLLSLLRVDDQPLYETYIYAEKLRPALRVNAHGYSGAAISPDGTILNYEVASQTMRRVVYELSGAQAWHRSSKNRHVGYWRDKDGNLRPLPPLRPKVLHSSTLQMN